MSFTKQVKKTLQREAKKGHSDEHYDYAALFRQKIFHQRNIGGAVVRLEKPTNLPRARSLGYKAKQGFITALVKIRKGSGLHRRPVRGRRPKNMGVKKLTRRISKKTMAEQKAGRKFKNCEVLNSYFVGQDGKSTFYEVILIDVGNPNVRADKENKVLVFSKHTKRAERGLTSSGKKGRGLKKGKGHEKNFPSQRAHKRKAK